MKTQIHKSSIRGHADHGWLKSSHTFSFANYYNPEMMGFGALRVINDDYIAPSRGFDTHPHKNMEIISVPIEGALSHKDTLGNEFVIQKGEVQVMSAGTGISHSEYNDSSTETTNLLQIWVLPKEKNIKPQYGQKFFDESERRNRFQLIVSPEGREGSLAINQDAFFSLVDLDEGTSEEYKFYDAQNGVYFFVVSGDVEIEGHKLTSRDGLEVWEASSVKILPLSKAEVLVMEVPL